MKKQPQREVEAAINPRTLKVALSRATRTHARLSATGRYGDLMRVSGQVLRIQALLKINGRSAV